MLAELWCRRGVAAAGCITGKRGRQNTITRPPDGGTSASDLLPSMALPRCPMRRQTNSREHSQGSVHCYTFFNQLKVSAMLMSERYRELFEELQRLQERWERCHESAERACHSENAALLQKRCGDVAHCLALFGDIRIEELSPHHVQTVREIRCSGSHSWLQGLRLIRPDLVQ